MADLDPAEGGDARAKKLSPEERKAIARQAANARWNKGIPKAVRDGVLDLGGFDVSCAVLEGGIRVISEREFTKTLGGKRGGSHWQRRAHGDGANLPVFLSAANLRPFISKDLALSLMAPISYLPLRGARANGIEATVIPQICDVLLKARQDNKLHKSQEHIAQQAEIIVRGLANVGIIALVDEATGYEDERPKNALAEILKAFISDELRKYAESFPLAYFRELCRLRGIEFRADMKLPKYFGHLTNNYIYRRLAPGVLPELQKVNPAENGRRKHKHYNHLTENIGHPKLMQLVGSVTTLMRISDTEQDFKARLDKIHPVYQPMPLFPHLEND